MTKAAHTDVVVRPQVAAPVAALKFAGAADNASAFAALLDTLAQRQDGNNDADAPRASAADDAEADAPQLTRAAPQGQPTHKSDSRRAVAAKAADKVDDDRRADAQDDARDDADARATQVAADVKADQARTDVKSDADTRAADNDAATRADAKADAQTDAAAAAAQPQPVAALAAEPVAVAVAAPIVPPVVQPVHEPVDAVAGNAKIPAIKPHGPVLPQPTDDAAPADDRAADASADTTDFAAPLLKTDGKAAAADAKSALPLATAPVAAAPVAAAPAKLEAAAPKALDPLLQRLTLSLDAQNQAAAPAAPAATPVAAPLVTAAVAAAPAPPAPKPAKANSEQLVVTNAGDLVGIVPAAANDDARQVKPALTAQPASDATAPTPLPQQAQLQAPVPGLATTPVANQATPARTPATATAPTPPVAAPAIDAGAPADSTAGAGKLIAQTYSAATAAVGNTRGLANSGTLAAMPPALQVAVQLTRSAKSGDKSFDIQLHPAELGRVEVKLEIDSRGNVTARVQADSQATLDQLQRGSHTLERALNDAGLKTTGDALNFSLRDGGQQSAGSNQSNGQQGQGGSNRSAGGRTGTALADQPATVDDDLEITNLTLGAARVDIRA